MSIMDYLARVERQYRYRIKTISYLGDAPSVAAAGGNLERLESVLQRFLLVDMGKPTKTPIQATPPDFPDQKNVEVWIVDVVLGLPASPPDLRRAIADAFCAPLQYVVVRGENEPTEIQQEEALAIAEIEAEAAKRGLKPAALLDDPTFAECDAIDGAELYGEKRNSALLGYLKSVQQEREEAAKVETKSPLFAWAGIKSEVADDFNADIKDAPKPATKPGAPPKEVPEKTIRRAFVDAKGNRVVLTRHLKAEG